MSLNKDNENSQKLNMAIPFVTYDDLTKKFIINDEAIKVLSKEENKQIGILSLVGKYRTGKSFLLNRVLIEKKIIKRIRSRTNDKTVH
jgi:predicted GTPase